MRIPSATGLVIASIALSGSTLAAPTGPPNSPNPSSPNPGLDSPRLPESPSLGQRSLLGPPAIREGSGRRRSLPRRAKKEDKKGKGVHAEGLGLLPDPLKNQVKGVLDTVGGATKDLPVVGGLLNGVLGATKGLVDALDVKKGKNKNGKPSAAHMSRSMAQLSVRDAPSPPSTPLGAIDPSAVTDKLSAVTDKLHAVTDIAEGVPVAGPIVEKLVDTVEDLLGLSHSNSRRSLLGNNKVATGIHENSHLGVALHQVGEGLRNTLSDILPRGLEDIPSTAREHLPHHARERATSETPAEALAAARHHLATRDLPVNASDVVPDPLKAILSTPGNVAAKTPAGGAPKLPVDPLAVASSLPPTGMQFVGPDGKIYATVNGIFQMLPSTPAPIPKNLPNPAQHTRRLDAGPLNGIAPVDPTTLAPQTDDLPLDNLPLDKLPLDKLPLDKLPVDKLPVDPTPQVGGPAQNVASTLGATVHNTPAGGVVDIIGGTIANSPGGTVAAEMKQLVGGLPVVGGTLGNVVSTAKGVKNGVTQSNQ